MRPRPVIHKCDLFCHYCEVPAIEAAPSQNLKFVPRREETMSTNGLFRLRIPLDASGIKDFKPDRAVKVIAFDAYGRGYEDIVKLDAKGQGTASLGFDGLPGNLHVVVGPHNASTEQMRGLQTITVEVSRRQWGDKKELVIPPVVIAPYYWWWWGWWCREFKITGVVRCANGDPVPGAKVCAYDVDWWWWWWGYDQVGCATTDPNGAFEIDFTWCCGWWPWFWWTRRVWLLEPTLAERISRLLRQEMKLPRIPMPGPEPDPAIFEAVLGEPGTVPTPMRGPRVAPWQKPALPVTRGARIDPASLEGLRKRLAVKLPPSGDFERLHLWPWWPWWPWWDCTPDIIFKATQTCHDEEQLIVNETIWDARWAIPTSLNVTLVANEDACCVTGSTCMDGGDCGFISDICEDNLDFIGGNPGVNHGASQMGYLNPGLASISGDRPYSGTIPLRGCVGTTVDYYEIMMSTNGFGGTWNPLPAAASGGVSRSYWDNGLKKWIAVPFPFNPISDGVTTHTVIESLPHWEANNGAKLWDAFTVDILLELVTQNVLADGTYYLRLRGWTRPGYAGNLSSPVDLPVCGSTDPTGVVVTIDNHLATYGPTDLNGHHCGAGTVHVCTSEPDTEIVSVKILHSDGRPATDLGACGNTTINDTDVLQIDFAAYDPDAHLAYYTLTANYDINLKTDLLNPALTGWSLIPSPAPPVWAPAAVQVGPNYGDPNPVLSALDQGASSPDWAGGAIRLRVNANAVFPYTCCYQLQLYAHKRTIGGGGTSCDHSFWNQYNVTEYSFTITV
jgi:hypothetical protein